MNTALKLLLELGASIGAIGTDVEAFVTNVTKDNGNLEAQIRDAATALADIAARILAALPAKTS